jgi:hypothetical protein
MDGREIALENPADKFLMSAVGFAAEIERENARAPPRWHQHW